MDKAEVTPETEGKGRGRARTRVLSHLRLVVEILCGCSLFASRIGRKSGQEGRRHPET